MAYMTTADQIRADERAKSTAQTLKETLQELLQIRFIEVPADTVATVNDGSIRDLKTWTKNFAKAETIDEVFNPKNNGHTGTNGSGPKK